MKKVILASQSKYKNSLFKQLAINFESCSPLFDEDSFDKESINPRELSQKMAYLKGEELASQRPDSIIISADQVCILEDTILSKSHGREKSINVLKMLQDKTHELMTSYAIFHKNQVIERTIIAKLSMKKLSDTQIEKYIDLDKPFDCAGSYKLESFGIALFDKIEVEDHTSIIGLPLVSLSKDLQSLGVKSFE